jgi:hypothetical protein
VNELYLELIKIKALQPPDRDRNNEKAVFFGLAGQIMKRLLIHHARPLSSFERSHETVACIGLIVYNP